MKKTILAIETSCDETGIALVQAEGGFSNPRFKVLKNLVSSQIKIHRPFGGVVPGLAKREHTKNLPLLFRKVFGISKSEFLQLATRKKFTKINFIRANQLTKRSFVISKQILISKLRMEKVDLIAVTVGPGLEPALWTGIEFATQLRSLIDADSTQTNAEKIQSRRKSALSPRKSAPKLIGVNHLEGHLYSFLLPQKTASSKFKVSHLRQGFGRQESSKLLFPAITLSVSGGHTVLLLMKNLKTWKKLGETRDDAAGEAFDKVARMLNLSYPGGPEIEKLAKKGNPEAIFFPRPMMNQKNYDFSFSGLKTAVLYHIRGQNSQTNADGTQTNAEKSRRKSALSPRKSADAANVAASFQQAVIDVLIAKTMRAAGEYGARSIILCGGVATNKKLRKDMRHETRNKGMNFFVPNMEYNNDNAAMIAAAAYMGLSRKKKYKLEANGNLNI